MSVLLVPHGLGADVYKTNKWISTLNMYECATVVILLVSNILLSHDIFRSIRHLVQRLLVV